MVDNVIAILEDCAFEMLPLNYTAVRDNEYLCRVPNISVKKLGTLCSYHTQYVAQYECLAKSTTVLFFAKMYYNLI